jgi:light-harvesting complex I chlorophyll a/b binding protein 1
VPLPAFPSGAAAIVEETSTFSGSDALMTGCVVSMLAVVGYSMTRTPNRALTPPEDLEAALELAGPIPSWSRTSAVTMFSGGSRAAPKKPAPKAAAKKPAPSKPAAKPAAKKPVAKKPVAKKPVAKRAVATKTVAKRPVAKRVVKRSVTKTGSKAGLSLVGSSNSRQTGLEKLREATFSPSRPLKLVRSGFDSPSVLALRAGSSIVAGDVGTTRPLGVYDPLLLMTKNPEKYRRFQEMEIKHGRIAMAATVHVLVTCQGARWGNGEWTLSNLNFPPLTFGDVPGGTWASWAALPQLGWFQIVAFIALIDNTIFAQDPDREPGDVVGDRLPWVRYKDPATRQFKLNSERNNGRAAMMGIFGMMANEALTGNPLYPLETPAMVAAAAGAAM